MLFSSHSLVLVCLVNGCSHDLFSTAHCSIPCTSQALKEGRVIVNGYVHAMIKNLLSRLHFPPTDSVFVSVLYSILLNDVLLTIFLIFYILYSLLFHIPFVSHLNLISYVLCYIFIRIFGSSSSSTWLWPETTALSVCDATAGLQTPWTTATTLCPAPFTLGKNCTVSSDLSRYV